MYRCERRTLCTGTGAQVSNRWMVQCCCCHGNRRAKGGGGEGWVLREERKWHKKGGREEGRVLLKGHSFAVHGQSFGDTSDHKWGKKKKKGEVLFERTRVSIKPTPFSSWAQASTSVLVLPLKLYLYSCSHVLRLFRGSNPRGREFIVYLLCFCLGSYPFGYKPAVFEVSLINLLQSHLFPQSDISQPPFAVCYQQSLKMCYGYRSKFLYCASPIP